MNIKDIYSLLFDYCCYKTKSEKVEEILSKYPDIDLMAYKDGLLFGLAISYECTETLKILLDHFENQLKNNPETRSLLKHKLNVMLEEEVEIEDAPIEIQELLKPYTFVEDTSSELSFEESSKEDAISIEWGENRDSLQLTEENLRMLSSSYLKQPDLLGEDGL